MRQEKMRSATQDIRWGMGARYAENVLLQPTGQFIFDMRDARTGTQLAYWVKEDTDSRSVESANAPKT